MECGSKGGRCSFCDSKQSDAFSGYCCSGVNHQGGAGPIQNGDCPAEAVAAQTGPTHTCILSMKMRISVYAGYVADAIEVNGNRYGASSGGTKYDVPIQEGETVQRLEFGIRRDFPDEEYQNAICGVYFVTNVQTHGPYPGRV